MATGTVSSAVNFCRAISCFLMLLLPACLFSQTQKKQTEIRPGEAWNDTQGDPINAHGGGILYDLGRWYWFGEIKKGKTWRVAGVDSWEDYRVDAGGVGCYSSRDLVNWKYEGIALRTTSTDTSSDLYTGRVVERPKVVYNDRTHQYVMWMHIDKDDYSAARTGVAVSDKIAGPYKYLSSVQPNNQMSRDMTLFKDADGKAYLIYSSENNQTMQVCELSEDYLSPTSNYKQILVGQNREAPAIFRYEGIYYLVTSLCTGWDPNMALYATSTSIMGDWEMKSNPCTGPDADSTYHAQSTFILPMPGHRNAFIFMADRWNKTDLENSRYVWLPMTIEAGKPLIVWKDNWAPELH